MRSAANRPSSQNASRQRNSPSNQSKTKTARIPETPQKECASIPIRFQSSLKPRNHSCRRETIPRELDSNGGNRNCRVAAWVTRSPTGRLVRSRHALRRQRGAIRLHSAILFRPTSRRRKPRRGSRTQASSAAMGFPRTSSGIAINHYGIPKRSDAFDFEMRCFPILHRSTAIFPRSRPRSQIAGSPDSLLCMHRLRMRGTSTRCSSNSLSHPNGP